MIFNGDLAKIDIDFLDELSRFDEFERMRQEKIGRRTEVAKKIKWKGTRDSYRIVVGEDGGTYLGTISCDLYGKWKMKPVFEWRKNSYNRNIIVNKEYFDFAECGRALVDLWIVS